MCPCTSIDSYKVIMLLNMPLYLNLFKSKPLAFIWIFAFSKVPLNLQYAQINPLALTFKPLKWIPFQLKYTFLPSNHSNQALLNSYMYLHPPTITSDHFQPKCAFAPSIHSNYVLIISNDLNTLKHSQLHSTHSNDQYPQNVHNCSQPTQIMSSLTKQNLNEVLFNPNDLNTFKCAQLHSTISN